MKNAKIGIVYNPPILSNHSFQEASLDIVTQVEAIEEALSELGLLSTRIPFTKNIRCFAEHIEAEKVDMAFNLCETVEEDPHFVGHPAALLELLGIPFSGSSSFAIMLTTDKLATKRILKSNAIRTPRYLAYDGRTPLDRQTLRFPVIVKPRFEDASIGIDQDSIYRNEETLKEGLKRFRQQFEMLMVEEYIEGREFNLSLFGYPDPQLLPIAEIDFTSFPPELYRILGYKAKWDQHSFEYLHTPRTFPRDISSRLLRTINATALRCSHLFMLRDYGRVDVRVDNQQRLYVLEVNTNPCLSPDAGFPAAIEASGRKYRDLVAELVTFALERKTNNEYQAAHP